MAGNYSVWRISRTTFAILLATAWSAQFARGQFTYVQDTDATGNWDFPVNWLDGASNTTYPNAVGATAVINAPIWTGTGNYNLFLPAGDITVGELKIDNTNFANSYRTNFANGGADNFRLVFQSTSGPAKYTETRGTAIGPANTQTDFKGRILVNSDLIINQDNYPNLNTGTIFEQLIEGAADKTIYKEGHGGIQFNYTAATFEPFNETPFQGKFVINQGGIRLLTPSPMSKSTGVTVSSGGQLMLADNNTNTGNANWDLASGAVLNLNGTGKATDVSLPHTVANPDGALRFNLAQNSSPSSSNFNNPVVLQSDSVISVIAGGTSFTTGVLTGAVTGPGGLTKHGSGTLVLSNASDSYGGDTKLLAGGPLSIANSILNDSRDVYLVTGSVLNLNFSGNDTIRSLYLNGVAQPVGTYGNTTSGYSSLITGAGFLNVTTLPVVGVAGDYNNNGFVDAADYVVWRKGGPLANEVDNAGVVNAQDYTEWRARFGNPPGSGSGLSGAAVPEPATLVLFILIAPFFAGRNLGRTRS
jgi:autotransporter-associated beta strand protein